MSFLPHDCPYCHTAKVSFKSIASYKKSDPIYNVYTVFLRCNHCENGIVSLIKQLSDQDPHQFNGDLYKSGSYTVVQIFPEPYETKAPEHLPPNIEKFFLEGTDNLNRGYSDSAGTMFKRVLDIATRNLCVNKAEKDLNLYPRIEHLAEAGIITSGLKDWAHEIRSIGNETSHEDEPVDPKDVKDLSQFTDLFLRYTFSLPGMLAERHPPKETEGDTTES